MKKFVAITMAALMVLSLAACGGSTVDVQQAAETVSKVAEEAAPAVQEAAEAVKEAAQEAVAEGKSEVNIGVLVWKYSDTYGSSVRVAMEKYAEELGAELGVKVNLEMQDGNDDQATQNNQADVMFAAGKDLIIINLCDTSAGQYLADLGAQYGVPFFFYNKEPNDSSLVTNNNSIFIGTKPEEAGIMQGEILADLYKANPEKVDRNGDGKVTFLEFEGEVNNAEAIARTEYSESTAIEQGVPLERLAENQVANWDTGKAQEMMVAQLAAIGAENIDVIFCNNDDMAIGVIAALNEQGYNLGDGGDEIVVIGVDATDTAIEYINAGKLYGTVKQDGDAMGKCNIYMAINGALGKDWLDGTDYKMADDGFSVRIPYAKITKE
ncbi:MAG: galactose ABC transporter substrate-binding protein [Lachnospiraceae bacterium]|nr:galactose ABC transporter substrate-binding protein [Lachnospiraceae bacterium]